MSAEELQLTLCIREVELRHKELEVEAMHMRVKALEIERGVALPSICRDPVASDRRVKSLPRGSATADNRECYYCREQGHHIVDCPSLERKEQYAGWLCVPGYRLTVLI
ncbi:hypothetical protein NQZ68_028140 [Dissostichus eleginoides]|nr:hypothetical protein NQZ68_028140 [Dissostichus eleginoides]